MVLKPYVLGSIPNGAGPVVEWFSYLSTRGSEVRNPWHPFSGSLLVDSVSIVA